METLYQVAGWQTNYENAKSRTIGNKSWCAMPNKQCGLGYCRIMQHPNGPAIYGAFCAIVLTLSKQSSPRDGWLTDSGQPDGQPLTADDLSIVTRIPEGIIQEMLDLLALPKVGWIRQVSASQIPTVSPQGYREDTSRIPDTRAIPPKKEGRKEGMEGGEGIQRADARGVVSGNGLQLVETDPDALAAKNLSAIFGTAWEAVRGRQMPAGHQAAAYRLCKLAIEDGQDPADMEDAMVWLSSNHGRPGVPTLKPPSKLGPDWFDAVADAMSREKHESKPRGVACI